MGHLFESVNFLDRDWDVRVLESCSLHSVFVWLLLAVLVFGMLSSLMLYGIFDLHRFNWTLALPLAALSFPLFRAAHLVYRRLRR
ncbi:MAG: hypothetical protein ABSF93_02790 [Candidatus Sulfotelmatobacter sp.]|jgi:hypothetical protein